ncbi:hypothetical protein Vretimale_12873 [Volvox reticuliferus]|nr:hypothetical protein Vretimale_12873 [Volvox reticuliferus]
MFNTLPFYLAEGFRSGGDGSGILRPGGIAAMFGLLNLVTYVTTTGYRLSTAIARSGCGMRGRLWLLWALQTARGVCCTALGTPRFRGSLPATAAMLVPFAVTLQQVRRCPYDMYGSCVRMIRQCLFRYAVMVTFLNV